MATRLNKVKIQAETSGFDKATKQTNQLSQAQERSTRSTQNLGKASAATGRQFAAQASGLGGFVAAYAGAAANIFAVQQAFSALARASQVETTIRGTRALAAEIGLSGDAIISKLQEVTQGQLTVAEAAQNANIALSAGFNTDQIADLTEVATRASKALGRNLTESLQRVFRGAIKLEPELLDEIGIFTRIEPAVEKYAASLNRSVSSLTQFERRQAFATAVIDEGQRKFSEIDLSSRSAQKSLEQLSAKFLDLATKVGIAAANFIEPFVSFLSKDFGNTLLVLGGIGTLVFKGLAQQVAQFTATATTGLAKTMGGLENFSRRLAGTTERFTQATAQAQGAAGAFTGMGAFAGRREVASAATEAKRNVMTGSLGSVAEVKAAREALKLQIAEERAFQSAVRDSNRTLEQKTAALEKSRGRTKALVGTIRELAVAEKQAGLGARFMAKAATVATTSITVFGNAISVVLSKLNLIFFAVTTLQGIFQLFGIDALGIVIEKFKSLGEENRKTEAGFNSLVSAVTKANKAMLEAAGINAKQYADGVRKSIENTVGLNQELSGTQKFLNKFILGDKTKFEVKTTDAVRGLKQLQLALEVTKELVDKGTISQEEGAVKISQYEDAIKITEKGLERYSYTLGVVAEMTGLTGKQTAAAFEQLKKAGDLREVNGQIVLFNTALGKIGEGGTAQFGSLETQILAATTKASNLTTSFADAFDAGSTNAEKASKTLLGLNNILDELNELQKNAGGNNQALADAINVVTFERNKQNNTTKELVATEKQLLTLRKAFSKEIKAVDDAVSSGLVGIDGSIAINALEKRVNLSKILNKDLTAYNDLLEREKEKLVDINNLNQTDAEIQKRGEAALKAQIGILIQMPELLEKTRLEEEKRTRAINAQTRSLELQSNLLAAQEKLAQNKQAQDLLAIDNKRLEIAQKRLDLININTAELGRQRKVAIDLLKLEQDRDKTTRAIQKAQIESAQASASADDQKALLMAQMKVAKEANSSSQRQLAARLNLLNVEFENEQNALARRKDIAEFEKNAKIAELNDRKKLLEIENASINTRVEELKNAFRREYDEVIAPRIAIEDRKRDLDAANLVLQLEQAEAQRQINIDRININEENKKAEMTILRAKYELLAEDARIAQDALNARGKLQEKEAKILNGILEALGIEQKIKFESVGDFDFAKDIGARFIKFADDADTKLSANFQKQRDLADRQSKITTDDIQNRLDIHNTITGLLEEERRLDEQIRTAGLNASVQELRDQQALNRQKISNIAGQIGLEEELFKKIMNQLDQEGQLALLNHLEKVRQTKVEYDTLENLAASLQNKIGGTLTESVNSFFDAISQGTLTTRTFRDGVNDLFISILGDIRQSFIDELINNPIKDLVKDFVQDKVKPAVGDLFKKKSADGSAALTGATVDPGLAKGQTGIIESKGAEITSGISNIMANVKGTTIAAFGGVLAATGNFKTAIIAAFVEMFVRIMAEKAATAFALAASGGEIGRYGAVQRFAKGGPVNKLRDRVPALLEPGEFVIRKPAAKAIGGSALNQLNATGKMNSNPNVTVNVQNNGTPQEVETSTVRNDMGQLVIDLVVKDIQNNGRVRKAMRG